MPKIDTLDAQGDATILTTNFDNQPAMTKIAKLES